MNVCVMTSVYALSESDRNGSFLVETTKYLTGRGHKVSVLAPSYEGRKDHIVGKAEVRRFRYFLRRWENLTHGQGAPNRIRNPLYLFVAALYIVFGAVAAVRFCRQRRFDVVHVHWPFPHGIWGYLVGKIYRLPVVLTFHGAEILLAKRFFFVEPMLRHALKHADGVICNSNYTARQVARLTDKPINVVPFGCTVTERARAEASPGAAKQLLFAGRLIRRKGLDYLLKALPIVLASERVHLHVVGDGDMADTWKSMASLLDLDHVATFHGIVSNERLEELYASADAFVLPAIVDDRGDTEGLGVVLVEALTFGTPVVASNVGGISDVIIDGETGLLVPEKDEKALAAAIVRLLDDRDLAQRLSQRGLEHARHYFDWNRITDRLLSVYEGAIHAERKEMPA